jgi:hypothetical protein
MHPAILICIILAVFILVYAIIIAILERDFSMFLVVLLVGDILFVGVLGFGIVCGCIQWNQTYEKVYPDKVESFIFKDNGIVAYAYEGNLYKSTKIAYLNAIYNIDYYVVIRKYNAYGYEVDKILYPVEKGEIYDYIKEK